MDAVNKVAIPAWLLAIASSYLVSYEVGAATTFGLVVQWTLKAPAKVADWLVPLVAVAAGLGIYIFILGRQPATLPPPHEWTAQFILWAGTALGVASVIGHTGGAPKTNTL